MDANKHESNPAIAFVFINSVDNPAEPLPILCYPRSTTQYIFQNSIATMTLANLKPCTSLLTLIITCTWFNAVLPAQEIEIAGRWNAQLASPDGPLRFGLELNQVNERWTGFLINGQERIEVPTVTVKAPAITLSIDHYDSVLKLNFDKSTNQLNGTWKKRRGLNEWVEMPLTATPQPGTNLNSNTQDPTSFIGRWEVDFESSDDPSVAIFEQAKDSHQVCGTFLTTTGDYRFLAGEVVDDRLTLSCFDGAHAFLFSANVKGQGADRILTGKFTSSMNWQENWTAKLNSKAKLPDAFEQTKTTGAAKRLGELSFPDLDGKMTRLDDPKFAGKARIIYVFGSWCPNCHDAASYFAQLEKKYGSKGLSIVGLAFELTGDFKRDAAQVQKYLKRHGSTYPVLVAGINDKADATKRLTILDKVRSYPTTIFLDSEGTVQAVHTGFTGPATGKAYEQLKTKFEKLIEGLLAEA